MKQTFLPFLLISIISSLVLYPTFYIGLYGDDWLAIFRYVVHIGHLSKGEWNHFNYFLTPYGSQDIVMGLLYQYFGTQSSYYQITAYIFRMIAAFSLYPLVFYLTKSKLATFFAILFFSITTTGFDSTGWLLTMPTYLTITFFNIFLYFYILFHDVKKLKFLFISGVFFYLAYVTASARMIGAPLFILSLEAFWLIKHRTIKNFKLSLLRIFTVLIVLVTIGISGHSLGNRSDWFDRLSSGVTSSQKLLKEGLFDFLFYPIVTVGGMFIPDFTLPDIQINTKKDLLRSVVIPALILLSLILLAIKSNARKITGNNIYKIVAAALVWIVIVFLVRKFNIITFSSSKLIMLLIIGGFAILIGLLVAIKYRGQNKVLTSLYISFSWTFTSFFLAWLWNPSSYIDTAHRYLTTSAVGISLFLATIISIGKKSRNKVILALSLLIFIVIHITATRTYINKLLDSHSQQITDNIWSSLPYIKDVGNKPLVFYFEGDASNGGILGDVIGFGFPFHMALLYNLTENDKFPVTITDWKELASAVKDGQSLKAYGYPLKPISIDQVYGFRLQGKANLVDITEEIRQNLLKEK